MTCRWLQSTGIPCRAGLAAWPAKIHPITLSVKSPTPYPSGRAPIPLIIVLTPWLALSRLGRSKGSAGGTAKVSRRCIRPVSVKRVTRRLAGSTRNLPLLYSRSSSKPPEIGRKFPSVGWFGRDFTLSPPSKQTGFVMFRTVILRVATLQVQHTIVEILQIVTSSMNDHPVGNFVGVRTKN